MNDFALQVYDRAHDQARSDRFLADDDLILRGESVFDLARQLLLTIEQYVVVGDFTCLLSPSRTFAMYDFPF